MGAAAGMGAAAATQKNVWFCHVVDQLPHDAGNKKLNKQSRHDKSTHFCSNRTTPQFNTIYTAKTHRNQTQKRNEYG
jgi:hypothetical protein